MGSGSFDSAAYRSYSSSTVGKTTDKIYTSKGMPSELNPFMVKFRESRDSADNPASTPVIVGLDVTGSMGMIADAIAREGLGTLFNNILQRKSVSNPHLMFMGIGDATCDTAPLQVSQFEADNRIVDQLTSLYLEGRGGGNSFESYNLPWYFAAFHTEHDAYQKRGKRGYLFTVGDEEVPQDLTLDQIKKFIGDDLQQPLTNMELLAIVERYYNVFHVVIEQGSHCMRHKGRVVDSWTKLLGQRVICLSDYTKLPEVVVSTIEICEGLDADSATSHWGGSVQRVVKNAVGHLPPGRKSAGLLGGPK
jgi:hypothetical protein